VTLGYTVLETYTDSATHSQKWCST